MHSIQRFLTRYWLATLALIGGISFGLSNLAATHEVEELYDAELAQYARIVEELVEQSWIQLDDRPRTPIPWPTQMESFSDEKTPFGHRYEHKLAVQVWSVDRRLLMRTINAPPTPLASFEPGYQRYTQGQQSWQVFRLINRKTGRWIMVAEQGEVRQEISTALTRNAVLPYLFGLPFLLLISGLLIRRALRPLLRLSEQLRLRDSHALTPVILDETPKELQPVTEALNSLLHDLAESFAREKRLTADAAHELRTPLTVLALHADNAIQARDETERQQALQKLTHGIQRSRRLLDQLLMYARVSSRPEQLPKETVDLTQVARKAIAELYPLLQQRQQDISLQASGPLPLSGNGILLETLICNLIDNASRYSPLNSKIEVWLLEEHERTVLEVHDSGPGIVEADRERALQPFMRLNSGDAQGAGLGFAIVSAICRLHQAEMALASSQFGGLKVTIKFKKAHGA